MGRLIPEPGKRTDPALGDVVGMVVSCPRDSMPRAAERTYERFRVPAAVAIFNFASTTAGKKAEPLGCCCCCSFWSTTAAGLLVGNFFTSFGLICLSEVFLCVVKVREIITFFAFVEYAL